MSNDGICHDVFADLHCHRFLGTGADQKSLAGSQEIYVLILALPPKGTVSVGSVQQQQSLWRICKSRTSRVTKWEAESIIFCPIDSSQAALHSRPSSTRSVTTVRGPALCPTTSPENCAWKRRPAERFRCLTKSNLSLLMLCLVSIFIKPCFPPRVHQPL